RKGGQILGQGRRRDPVGDVHAPRGRRGRDGGGFPASQLSRTGTASSARATGSARRRGSGVGVRRELLRSERRADGVIVRAAQPSDVAPAQRLLAACGLPLGGFPEDLEAIVVATSKCE